MMDIQANLELIWERIASAAHRAGRSEDEVTLVGVTKTHPAEVVLEAFAAGLQQIGENRVEEMEAKRRQVEEQLTGAPGPVWHMIGHVQSRKAGRVVAVADMLHALDSPKLARRLDRFAAEAGRVLPVLLEVNLSGEEGKYGWPAHRWSADAGQWAALREFVAVVMSLPHLDLQGLMTMAPWVPDPDVVRPVFRSARLLRERLAAEYPAVGWQALSMGMTDDFEMAVEEGATIVRVGRAIFGPRQSFQVNR